MQKASSARLAPKSSSLSRGRPRAPVSDDPAIELKREKQRASALKYKEKKKALAGASAGASAKSTASSTASSIGVKKRGRPPLSAKMGTGTASAMTTVVAPPIINPVNKKEVKAKALSTIGRAIKGNLARKELAELKQDKKFGDVDLDLLTTIKIPYRDAKKYFSKDLAMLKYINRVYRMENDNKEPDDISLIELEYMPFSNYDYFVIPYFDPKKANDDEDEVAKIYRTKVPRNRDTDYSDYLYNKYITPPSNPNRYNYNAMSGSGSIPMEGNMSGGKRNPFSPNNSSVGSKSDAVSQVSNYPSSNSSNTKRGTNSSNSSDSMQKTDLKRYRRNKLAGKYSSSSSNMSEKSYKSWGTIND